MSALTLGGLALSCAACGGFASNSSSGDDDGTYLIGYMAPLTGSEVEPASAVLNAAKLRLKEMGTSASVKFKLEVVDDACDAKTAANAANKLVSMGADAVIAGWCSDPAQVAEPIFDRAGIPFVLAAPTSSKLVNAGFDNVVQSVGNASNEGDSIVYAVNEMLDIERLAVVDDQSGFSTDLADAARDALDAAGTPAATSESVPATTSDFSALLDTLSKDKVDGVLWTGYYAQGASLLKQARTRGFDGEFLFGDSNVTPAFIEAAPDVSDGVLAVSPPSTEIFKTAEGFTSAYQDEYGEAPSGASVLGYDAVTVLIDAVNAASDRSPKAVIAALRATDTTGATGPIAFDDKGARKVAVFPIVRVVDGQWKLADEQPPSIAQYIR
ncbi:branched-chain amino acid ABC transporter substrate-binding protein [Pimelobacter simplex]|uniref:branched-chain amino acid ABC transporter substrate-binding protein n=1 Tax=Nocardioides simplex TaxID=2045 RepID=UPI003AAC3791